MAMSVTITDQTEKGITMVKFAWVSETQSATGTSLKAYNGNVIALVTDPGVQPTDDYDVTILDENGLDVLAGAGADRDELLTEYVTNPESLGVVSHSKLTLNIGTAGDAKTGDVYLYLQNTLRWE